MRNGSKDIYVAPTYGGLDTRGQRESLSVERILGRVGIPFTVDETSVMVVQATDISKIETPFDPGIADRIRAKITEAIENGAKAKIIGNEETETIAVETERLQEAA